MTIKHFATYMFPGGNILIQGEDENGQISLARTIIGVIGYSQKEVEDLLEYEGWFPEQGNSYIWTCWSSFPNCDGLGLEFESWVGHWEAPVTRRSEGMVHP